VRAYRPSIPAENANAEDTESDESRLWTAVEYMFIPQTAGNFLIGSFEISAGDKRNYSSPIVVQVRAPPQVQRQVSPSFYWERIPSVMTAGSAMELTLVLSNWDTAKPTPRNLFRGRIPENSILEELPFIWPGADGLIRYPVKIIPLESGSFILNPLEVQYEGGRLTIPRISVSVVEADSSSRAELPSGQTPLPIFMEENVIDNNAHVFPQNEKKVFRIFQKEYDSVVTQVALLWENGQYAQALALVRMNERDRIYGSSLIPLRRSMEEELGLSFSTDEKTGFVYIPLLFFVLAVFFACFAFQVTSRKLKGYSHIIRIIMGGMCLFFLVIAVIFTVDAFKGTIIEPMPISQAEPLLQNKPGGSAILESTHVYRIPDPASAVIFGFDQGQAVRIRSFPGPWMHVESPDGRSGWVPAEAVIPY
jgi:hypothetical protein